jgi:cell division protein ZapE
MTRNTDKEKVGVGNNLIPLLTVYMIIMTPKQRYLKDLDNSVIKPDSAQAMAVDALDILFHQFVTFSQTSTPRKLSLLDKLKGKTVEVLLAPKGLYMWGGVGRGKTYLMDTFYDELPTDKKMRVHFHRFMYRVHDELRKLHAVQDPLEQIADIFKGEVDIICFDEFFVSDITDAMILGTLFEALFSRGVILVATSNTPPQDLYRNGLQRARFLPAIALIEKNCQVLNVDSGVDYRLRTLESAHIYHFPNDEEATANLEAYFSQLVGTDGQLETSIDVNHRQIEVNKSCHGVLFVSFEQLCQSTRSQNDYIELSKIYHTVLLSDVRTMNTTIDDAARRFIALVDEFYERHVKLIISAEVAIDQLYQFGQLEFEFRRCCSRLTEMQSHEYLAKPHLG